MPINFKVPDVVRATLLGRTVKCKIDQILIEGVDNEGGCLCGYESENVAGDSGKK